MRAVIQKVKYATLRIENEIYSHIDEGLMILLGIEDIDTEEDIEWLSAKICKMRIFDDENGVMNLSVEDIGGEIMVVSQFTLHASCKKGNPPTYIRASKPDFAKPMYEKFVEKTAELFGKEVKTGVFGADMQIEMINNGPTTIIIDTKNKE
jgi:D-tyrosyl-tRNA(Tyr) deacylase